MDSSTGILRRPAKTIRDKNHTFNDDDYLKEIQEIYRKKVAKQQMTDIQRCSEIETTSAHESRPGQGISAKQRSEAAQHLQLKQELREKEKSAVKRVELSIGEHQRSMAEKEQHERSQKRALARQIAEENARMAEVKRSEKLKAKIEEKCEEVHQLRFLPGWK